MSSGQRSIEYLNNNNNTTTTVISTLPNAEPSHNSKRTITGWFLQWTRGWPWSSWTRKITPTKHYYKTPTPTKCSLRIPQANSRTNSSPFLKTLNKQEASPPTNTNSYIPQVQYPQILWPAPNPQNRYTPQAHCFQ